MQAVYASMLSESTVQYLSAMHYRADAKLCISYLPIGGIYWDDEVMEVGDIWTIGGPDCDRIFQLFGIRAKIWMDLALSSEERIAWNEAQAQVPNWALFHRLDVSENELRLQCEAAECADAMFETMTEDADLVSMYRKDGMEKYRFTFRVDKEKRNSPREVRKEPWWIRLFRTR